MDELLDLLRNVVTPQQVRCQRKHSTGDSKPTLVRYSLSQGAIKAAERLTALVSRLMSLADLNRFPLILA